MTDLWTAPRPFDVCGELPTGVTVLEASAGTGKTFTIAALAARYVAEGIPLEKLLLVTFTRMATGELRERVRERLVSAEQGLTDVLKSQVIPENDDVVALLASAPPDVVETRRDRLARAVAGFDAATIATTHQFCQEVLSGLGIAGDVEPDTVLVEEIDDLVQEVVDDLYVRRFHRGGALDVSRGEALEIARVAVGNPGTRMEPSDAPEHTIAAMRVRLAQAVCRELEQRKRRAGVMTYDDLLTRLDETLRREGSGEAAARRLRERYRVVLIDEFQDTDPVQWDILKRAFGDGGVTLVLIGDPKQAIYAFRGADVYAYLRAADDAQDRRTLDVNWRSDQGLIEAYDAMFGGARLGHEGIVYRSVRACDANLEPRLSGAPVDTPLRVRVVHRDDPAVALTRGGLARNASAREFIADDLAADLRDLLESGARIERRAEGEEPSFEAVQPGHIAVLVRTHRNAALVRDALDRVGVPAVINGAGSVFGTAPAREWLRLLEAIERPTVAARARAAALTSFLGWTAAQVATADDLAWEELHRKLHRWARILRTRGVASLTEAITLGEGLPGRVLSQVDGERRLTDLRHVAQLLHAAAMGEQMGTTALTGWLRQRVQEAENETSDEERSRRLESDEQAVQVLTIHRSKGLEFPIVYYPYLWEPGYIPSGEKPVFFHDPQHGHARTIDVGLDGPQFPRHQAQHEREQRGEDLRLAYVALTRAKHQAVVWWAGSWDSRNSALGRLLFARDAEGNVPPSGRATPRDEDAVARFEELAAGAPGRIVVERAERGAPTRWSGIEPNAGDLSAATFDRTLDRRWRRTSYTDITADADHARVGSEPEDADLVRDELPVGGPTPPALRAVEADGRAGDSAGAQSSGDLGGAGLRARSLLADMPGGVHVGTFVHHVFEALDFAAPDLDAALGAETARVQAARRVELGDVAAVREGLRAVVETPLGQVVGDRALRDFARADRLDELAFELPLVGGDEPHGELTLSAIGAALRRHTPAGHPVAAYADRLADPALKTDVRGYLTGSIDLVMRLPDGRFAIADYKTNWLAPPDEELTLWHHRPAAVAAEMQRSHYVLQALLYTVALHRYLRWRLPGYDADRHLAGVVYLFVRGMAGPDTPRVDGTPCGVFEWQPSGALVAELSDVLDRGGPA